MAPKTKAAETRDVTPPVGSIEIMGATNKDGVNYVESENITVKITAQDDVSEAGKIKYYIDTVPLSEPSSLEESKWQTYSEGATVNLTLPNKSGTNTVYLVLKDEAGNTSKIYKEAENTYTVTYDVNHSGGGY